MHHVSSTRFEISSTAGVPSMDCAQRRFGFRYRREGPWLLVGPSVSLEVTLDAEALIDIRKPPWLYGMINWRGRRIPVFDPDVWFTGRRSDVSLRQTVVITAYNRVAALLSAGAPRVLTCSPRLDAAHVPTTLRPFVTHQATTPDGAAYAFSAARWLAMVSLRSGCFKRESSEQAASIRAGTSH